VARLPQQGACGAPGAGNPRGIYRHAALVRAAAVLLLEGAIL